MKSVILNIVDQAGSLNNTLKYLSDNSVNLQFLGAWRVGDGFGTTHLVPKNLEDAQKIKDSTDPQLGVVDPLVIDVFSFSISDEFGSLQKVLARVADENINIDFCFAFSVNEKQAMVILGVPQKKFSQAVKILQESGILLSGDNTAQ